MEKKHVLVVGAISLPHQHLIELNCRISWFWTKSDRKAPSKEDNDRCDNILIHHPDTSTDTLVEFAKVMHAADPFDAVVAFHDDGQKVALAITDALGMDYFISKQALENTSNKPLMRQILQQHQLNSVPFKIASQFSDIQQFFAQHPSVNKIITKPEDGTGSEGVASVTRDDIQNHSADSFSWLQYPLLLEAFVEGREFSVEGVSLNNQHHIIAITEKFKHPGSYMESGHLVPARLSDDEQEAIISYCRDALNALEVDHCLTHSEIILGEQGPVLIETHTRGGGDHIWDLVTTHTGVDLIALSARLHLGLPVSDELLTPVVNQDKHAAVRFMIQQPSTAPIKAIDGLETAKAIEDIENIFVTFNCGEYLPEVKHSFDRAVAVLATATTADAALAAADKALNTVTFQF